MKNMKSTSLLVREYLKDVLHERKQYRTITEFAAKAHISQPYISAMLSDDTNKLKNPSSEILDKLAKVFGLSTWEFLKRAEDHAEKKTLKMPLNNN